MQFLFSHKTGHKYLGVGEYVPPPESIRESIEQQQKSPENEFKTRGDTASQISNKAKQKIAALKEKLKKKKKK